MINVPLHEDSGLTCKSNNEIPFLPALHTNPSLIREAGLKDMVMQCGHINSYHREKLDKKEITKE